MCCCYDIMFNDDFIFEDDGYGYSSGGGGGGFGGGSRSRMDDLDDFGARNRRMNPVEQAFDKAASTVKEMWNNRPTRRNYDSGGPYGGYG